MLGNRVGSQELIQLGERVRQKRKDCHLSQETLAEKVGISVNTVSRINVNIKMYIFDHLRMYIFAILPLDRYIFLSDKIFL